MEELPFLVVHGWWIAKLLVVLPPVIVLALLVRVRRKLDLRRARALVTERSARVSAVADGELATIRGRYCSSDDGPVVVSGDDRVSLEGPVTVLRGSHTRWTIRMDEPAHTVVGGDDVIVSGQASRRERDGSWTITDGEIVSTTPVACPEPMVLTHFFLTSLVGVVAYLALQALGTSLLGEEHLEYDRRTRDDLSGERLVFAAALPGVRDEALHRLERVLHWNFVRSEQVLARRLELEDLRGEGCLGRYRIFDEEGRAAEMLGEARRCDYKAGELRALDLLGRFDEAADLADDAQLVGADLDVLIQAGRWKAAADALAGRPHSSDAMICVSELFRHHAHDAGAVDRLAARAANNPQCKFILAVARNDTASARSFFEEAPQTDRYPYRLTRVGWAIGVDLDFSGWSVSSELEGIMDRGTGWFASFAVGWNNTSYAHEALAIQFAVRGELSRARAEVAAAVSLIEPKGDAGREISLRSLDGLLQVRAGISPVVARPPGEFDWTMSDVHAALDGLESSRRYFSSGGKCPGLLEAMRSAVSGDGRPLAAAITECHFESFDAAVLAVLPRVRSGGSELAAAFRSIPNVGFVSHIDTWPFEYLDKLAVLRDAARLLDDHDRERALQEVIDRFTAMLSDRQKLFALALVRIDG